MTIHTRAAVMYAPNAALVVEDIELADPGPNEVLIRLKTAGLCHSDLSFLDGRMPHAMPVVLGHEGLGEVLALGEGVGVAKVGDTVIPYLVPDCGVCPYCRSGRTNMCVQMGRSFMPGYKTWMSVKGVAVQSFMGLGCFSEYIVASQDQVQVVNPAASPAEACSIGCGVTTGLGSALIVAEVEAGSTVVVFGMGGVGLSLVQGARIAGAKTIIAVDVMAEKEAAARQFGATHFFNSKTQVVEAEVMKLTNLGADYAFDCVGSASVFKTGLASLSRGGWAQMVNVGINYDEIAVPMVWSDLGGRVWRRSFMGGAKRKDMAGYVDWFVDGKIDLGEMVSHHLELDEINEGFDLMRQGKTKRAVIHYS